MAQPGRDEDRIIPLVNQPVASPSPRPFHAKCGRTTFLRQVQIRWGLASAALLAFGGIVLAKVGLAGR